MIHPNSKKVFRKKVQPNLTERQQQVYNALKQLKNGHVYDIAARLRLPVNSVSGRLSELSSNGLIVAKGYKMNKYKNNCTLWTIAA